jgi:hypothetical protein
VQGKIAAGGERLPRPLPEAAAERPHRQIVGHQNAVEPDLAADDLGDQARRQCRRRTRIDGRIDDVRGHCPGHRGKSPERRKIRARQFFETGLDPWAKVMAVDAGAAVARYVLKHRQDGAVEEARTNGAGETRGPFGIVPKGPIANHRIGPGHRKIQHGQAIDGDAEPRQVVGDQPSAEAGGSRRRRVR